MVMKVKKYVSTTMPEAMSRIRKEMGPDAVILNTREWTEKGFLGLFKKKKIEVLAGLDPHPLQKNKRAKQMQQEPLPSKRKMVSTEMEDPLIMNEIKELKMMLQHQAFQSKNNYLPEYEVLFQYLLEQEIAEPYVEQIINNIVEKHLEMDKVPKVVDILADVQTEIINILQTTSFEGITYGKKVVQFVGPTGVGKTTTLAKVAAHSMMNDQKKVAFITTDTYRIAAIEQLKTYARILNVPIEVAYSVDDYKRALDKYSNYDLILVDTAGRNYRDEQYVQELKKLIHFDETLETYLVLSLTAKSNDILQIYDQFTHLSIKKVIFTKIDETNQYGNILNLVLHGNVEIAYLTNGQDVPDDLLKPSPENISELIISRYKHD